MSYFYLIQRLFLLMITACRLSVPLSVIHYVVKVALKGWSYLEERCEDDSACIAKFKGGEQLRQDFVFTEIFREGIEIVAQILEELLLLGWLLDLERTVLRK